MNDQQIEDLFEFYVLGTLSEEEQIQVESYIVRNPQARARLEEMMQVSKMLPFGVEPMDPSPKVKETLMARVRANAESKQAALQAARPAEKIGRPEPPSWSLLDWLRSSLAVPVFAAACVILLIVVGAWAMNLSGRLAAQSDRIATLEENSSNLAATVAALESENITLASQIERLQSDREELTVQVAALSSENGDLAAQIADLETDNSELVAQLAAELAAAEQLSEENAILAGQLAAQEEVMALFSSPQVQTVSIAGTESQPDAEAQIIYDAEKQVAILVVTGLEELANDEAYQVLLIRNDGHDTAETFRVDTQGYSVLLVHSLTPFNTFNAVGVSIEPAGGSPQRTGEIVLLGDLVN
jgi:anti-sigma-K factor RskA